MGRDVNFGCRENLHPVDKGMSCPEDMPKRRYENLWRLEDHMQKGRYENLWRLCHPR